MHGSCPTERGPALLNLPKESEGLINDVFSLCRREDLDWLLRRNKNNRIRVFNSTWLGKWGFIRGVDTLYTLDHLA
ncbi:uncharacterized protein VTP21DRAFT_9956 [Calcarisporiella thermophila]|uniref:uncharacterized protein n=1 Tax=Calcarisporiella thermophila TaxID=911321 RepID=UPI00374452BB